MANRFDYSNYVNNRFATHDELTNLASLLLDAQASWFSVIVNTIRVMGVLALFKIREKMYAEERLIGKQIYEQKRYKKTKLADDNLDE